MEKMTWTTKKFRIVVSMNEATWSVMTFDPETGELYRFNSRVFRTEGEAVRYADWLAKA